MSSWVVEYASQGSSKKKSGHEDGNRRLDLYDTCHDPRASSNLSLPAETILRAAVSLKDQVVEMTWRRRRWDNGVLDPTVYTGLMGTAFTCLRSYEATGNRDDLRICAEIVDTCAASRSSLRHVTYLCGRGGIYALGAISSNYLGNQEKRELYVNRFLEMMSQESALPVGPDEGGFGMSYDLLYGRAGFLWAALYLNKHLGPQAISTVHLMPIVQAVLAGGRAGSVDNPECPLMYRWHGTRYWGSAHGLAGILHVLLHFPELSDDDIKDVKATLRCMMSNRFPHSGNYPVSEGSVSDKLVQWSHGATGVGLTLCKASEVFPEFRQAAIEAGEVVWKSGLIKKTGLADGTSGNAYAFLSLLRLTGDNVYDERAKAFAGYLYHSVRDAASEERRPSVTMTGMDHTYSLFHGLAGVACLWFDLFSPHGSRFPGYEI